MWILRKHFGLPRPNAWSSPGLGRLLLVFLVFWVSLGTATAQHRWIVSVPFTQGPTARHFPSFLPSPAGIRSVNAFSTDATLLYVITSFDTASTQGYLDSLYQKSMITYFEKDAVGYGAGRLATPPNDPGYPLQWYVENNGDFEAAYGIPSLPHADASVAEAWHTTHGTSEVTVAILDSGVLPDHPEFENRLFTNPKEVPENSMDDDRNGYPDDTHGWDFVNNDRQPDDDNGHGTSVAGIIAANGDNGFGISGIDWHCRILVCKVLDQDRMGFHSNWARAIYYAIEQGADIINMSLTSLENTRTLQEAVEYAQKRGILIVSSTGNNGSDIDRYPAAYPSVLSVGSTDPDDQRSTSLGGTGVGGNFGDYMDVVAPGNFIYSLTHTSFEPRLWSGTSMSCAVVTGVASLLLAVDDQLTGDQLKTILIRTAADRVGSPEEDISGWDRYYGFGRIDAARAIQFAHSSDSLSIPNPFVFSLSPNPTTGWVKVSTIFTEPTAYTLTLLNTQGEVIRTYQGFSSSRDLSLSLDLRGISASLYFLRLIHNGKLHTERLLLR